MGVWDELAVCVFAYSADRVSLWRSAGNTEILSIPRDDIVAVRAEMVENSRNRMQDGLAVILKSGEQQDFVLYTRLSRHMSRAPGKGHAAIAAEMGSLLRVPASS